MEFELKRLIEYSDEAILAELRRVAALIPDGPIPASILSSQGRVSIETVIRRFGAWHIALELAGLADRSSDNRGFKGPPVSRKMSNDDILASLLKLAIKLQRTQLTVEDVEENLPFSRYSLIRRWGTSHAAFEAAGLTGTKLEHRYTDEHCFNNLLKVWTHYGRPPKHKEMSFPPSEVGGKAYMLRFGTWNKALAAFVERVNEDQEPEPNEKVSLPAATVPSQTTVIAADERRDISIGLRFRVLHRDRFKCVLCGDHPARNADCVLHVDHILPWSRGGKTREDNLRTLCAPCNVGRGNRFVE